MSTMMRLLLVASLIALVSAVKDLPRRQVDAPQRTERSLRYGKGGKGGSTTQQQFSNVANLSTKASKLPSYFDEQHADSFGRYGAFGGENSDPDDKADSPKALLRLIQNGAVSTDQNANYVPFWTPGSFSISSPAPSQFPSTAPSSTTLKKVVGSLVPSSAPSSSPPAPTTSSSDVTSPVPSLAPSESAPTPIASSSDVISPVPSLAPSESATTPIAFSSDVISPVPSLAPSESATTPIAFSSDAASPVPSSTLSSGVVPTPTELSSDVPSLVTSPAPSPVIKGADVTPTEFSSGVPSVIPFPVLTAFSSDLPSLVPSSAPSQSLVIKGADITPTAFSSDVPSLVPSSAALSDRPSLVPSSVPSSGTVPKDSIPSSIASDIPSAVPSVMPSDYPSVVPTSYPVAILNRTVFDGDSPPGFVTCAQFESTAFEESAMVDLTVQYWYELGVENDYDSANGGINRLVETVEVVLLEAVQDAMCGGGSSTRRLQTETLAFSAAPSDLRMGTCGSGCYPIYGAMKVKVDQSITKDSDAYGSMYCAVLQIIHDTIGTSELSSLTGIQSTVMLDHSAPYTCDLDGGFGGLMRGRQGDDQDTEDVPVGVAMSFVVAGGLIAFTALFLYCRRKQRHPAAGAGESTMDLDTTVFVDAASVDIVRRGIDPPPTRQQSPMSQYLDESLYTTDSHEDDTLLMANSGESWNEVQVDLTPMYV